MPLNSVSPFLAVTAIETLASMTLLCHNVVDAALMMLEREREGGGMKSLLRGIKESKREICFLGRKWIDIEIHLLR